MFSSSAMTSPRSKPEDQSLTAIKAPDPLTLTTQALTTTQDRLHLLSALSEVRVALALAVLDNVNLAVQVATSDFPASISPGARIAECRDKIVALGLEYAKRRVAYEEAVKLSEGVLEVVNKETDVWKGTSGNGDRAAKSKKQRSEVGAGASSLEVPLGSKHDHVRKADGDGAKSGKKKKRSRSEAALDGGVAEATAVAEKSAKSEKKRRTSSM